MLTKRYIAIEGPIGVGKTSLAKRLADVLTAELVLEEADENPFLERFYIDPKRGALPAQLYFLFQRTRQMHDLKQGSLLHATRISDYILAKDRLFAELTLDTEELGLYEQVWQKLNIEEQVPDLVIYLQAPAEILLQRIEKRGIAYECGITANYLRRVVDAYSSFFFDYNDAPLLIVNAAQIDPVNVDAHLQTLLQEIEKIDSGRHYFNPGDLVL